MAIYNKGKTMKKKAFTLTELIVVVCCIAFLAALASPLLAQAQGNSRTAQCQKNLKALGEFMLSYTDDNDSVTPDSYYDKKLCLVFRPLNYTRIGTKNRFGISTLTYDYMDKPDILTCPEDTGGPAFAEAYRKWRTAPEPYNASSMAMMSYGITYPRKNGSGNFALAADNWNHKKRSHLDKTYNTVFADGSVRSRVDENFLVVRESGEYIYDVIFIMGIVMAPEYETIKDRMSGSYKSAEPTCLYKL